MDIHLVVVRPFGGLGRGDLVAETARISDILSSGNRLDVVRVQASPTSENPASKTEG